MDICDFGAHKVYLLLRALEILHVIVIIILLYYYWQVIFCNILQTMRTSQQRWRFDIMIIILVHDLLPFLATCSMYMDVYGMFIPIHSLYIFRVYHIPLKSSSHYGFYQSSILRSTDVSKERTFFVSLIYFCSLLDVVINLHFLLYPSNLFSSFSYGASFQKHSALQSLQY